jgi:hypothetical protein
MQDHKTVESRGSRVEPSSPSSDAPRGEDLLARLPWLRRLPSEQDLKQLKFEASWSPAAQVQLNALVARLKELQAAAAADEHAMFHPTHIAERGASPSPGTQGLGSAGGPAEILGFASMGAIPLVNVWFDRQKCKGRDSLTLFNMVENEAARAGFRTICVPCTVKSPLRPIIEKGLGYSYFGETGLFLKILR